MDNGMVDAIIVWVVVFIIGGLWWSMGDKPDFKITHHNDRKRRK